MDELEVAAVISGSETSEVDRLDLEVQASDRSGVNEWTLDRGEFLSFLKRVARIFSEVSKVEAVFRTNGESLLVDLPRGSFNLVGSGR